MARLPKSLSVVALATGLAGCSAGEDGVEGTAGHELGMPAGCRPAPVARLLTGYFEAVRRGDAAGAASFVSPTAQVGIHFDAAARSRLRLRAVAVGYASGLGHVELRLGGRAVGKGAVDCQSRRLVALGAGTASAAAVPSGSAAPSRAREWR